MHVCKQNKKPGVHRYKSKNFLPKPVLFQYHNYNKNTTRIWKIRLQSDNVRNRLLFNNKNIYSKQKVAQGVSVFIMRLQSY